MVVVLVEGTSAEPSKACLFFLLVDFNKMCSDFLTPFFSSPFHPCILSYQFFSFPKLVMKINSTVGVRFSEHRFSGKPCFKGHSSKNLSNHFGFFAKMVAFFQPLHFSSQRNAT